MNLDGWHGLESEVVSTCQPGAKAHDFMDCMVNVLILGENSQRNQGVYA